MVENEVLQQYIELTNFHEGLTEAEELIKEKQLLNTYSIETLNIHFRGIPFIYSLLGLESNYYFYYVKNWSKKCEYIRSQHGKLANEELTSFLNFAISDIRAFAEVEFYLYTSSSSQFLVSVTYQSDISLIFLRDSKFADNIQNLEKKFPLLYYKNL